LPSPKEGQITDRLTRAIEQFASQALTRLDVHLGGIYTLREGLDPSERSLEISVVEVPSGRL
jgi:hypothetical protein